MYKIMIIDDEIEILNMLEQYFSLKDYQVILASNTEEALGKLNLGPDLIILDINMPGENGFQFCQSIRNFVSVPIIFLTARISPEDRIKGLMLGGDDYISKPFSLEELGARVHAHIRRENRQAVKNLIRFQEAMTIDYSKRQLLIAGQEIYLTKIEFDLVEVMSLNQGQVFSKDRLYDRITEFEGLGNSGVVTEHIRRIRNKFLKHSDYEYIKTVWGVGYRWDG